MLINNVITRKKKTEKCSMSIKSASMLNIYNTLKVSEIKWYVIMVFIYSICEEVCLCEEVYVMSI